MPCKKVALASGISKKQLQEGPGSLFGHTFECLSCVFCTACGRFYRAKPEFPLKEIKTLDNIDLCLDIC